MGKKSFRSEQKHWRVGQMRELVLALGGPLRGDENRKRWLDRVAAMAGLKPNDTHRAWYGKIRDPEHKIGWKLREAVEREANKYRKVASLLNTAASELEEVDTGGAISARTLARQLARELINLAEENGE